MGEKDLLMKYLSYFIQTCT